MGRHLKHMIVLTLVLLCCLIPLAEANVSEEPSIQRRIAYCPFCNSATNAYETCGGSTYVWETDTHAGGCTMTLYARDTIYGCSCGWRYVVGQHRCYITHSSCGAGREDLCLIGDPPIIP